MADAPKPKTTRARKPKQPKADKQPKVDLNFSFGQLWQLADTLFDKAERENPDLPGRKKMNLVLDELARFVDESIQFGGGPLGGLAEAADYYVARAVLALLAQFFFDKKRDRGEI
jgi:hypothetical protein